LCRETFHSRLVSRWAALWERCRVDSPHMRQSFPESGHVLSHFRSGNILTGLYRIPSMTTCGTWKGWCLLEALFLLLVLVHSSQAWRCVIPKVYAPWSVGAAKECDLICPPDENISDSGRYRSRSLHFGLKFLFCSRNRLDGRLLSSSVFSRTRLDRHPIYSGGARRRTHEHLCPLISNTVELISTLGAFFPEAGPSRTRSPFLPRRPVHDPVITTCFPRQGHGWVFAGSHPVDFIVFFITLQPRVE